MTKNEAVTVLNNSRCLALQLMTTQIPLPLYPDEDVILLEFQNAIEEGYGTDQDVRKTSNLSSLEFMALQDRLDYHYARGKDQSYSYTVLQHHPSTLSQN